MNIEEIVAKWNARWRYDFWWRTKYNIPFGSAEHRAANQIDIYFEYVEGRMLQSTMDKIKDDEEKAKKFKELGIWLNPVETVDDADWDKLSLATLSKDNKKES